LEELIRAGLELPAFSTLDEMAGRIRVEVNRAIFDQILARMTSGDRDRLTALLDVVWPDHTSAFNRLKKPAKRATWSHFKVQIAHLRWVDSLGDTGAWFDGIAPSKIADFAGEASAGDAAVLGRRHRSLPPVGVWLSTAATPVRASAAVARSARRRHPEASRR